MVRLGFGSSDTPPFYGRARSVGLNAIYPRICRRSPRFIPADSLSVLRGAILRTCLILKSMRSSPTQTKCAPWPFSAPWSLEKFGKARDGSNASRTTPPRPPRYRELRGDPYGFDTLDTWM